jgi:hypothetical protein
LGNIVSFLILQEAEVRELGKDSFLPLSFRGLRSDSWGRIVSFLTFRRLRSDSSGRIVSFLYPSEG